MSIALPQEKIQKISERTQSLLLSPTPSAREIARMVGILSSCILAVMLAPLHYRALQATKNQAIAMGGYDHRISLPRAAKVELHWWYQHLTSHNGKPIKSPQPDLILYTDASLLGWGATCQGVQIGGAWSMEERSLHINCLELLGASNAVQSFSPREDKPCGSDMDGQYKCDILHQPYGRNTFISAGSDSSAILDMGPPEGDHAQGKTHSRGGECHSGQDVTNDCQRPVRLAVKSNNLLEDSSSLGSISCRHVCNKTVDPSPSILLMETRTPSRSYGCFSSGLVYSPGIRTPTLVSHTTLPEEGSDPGSNVGHGHSPLVNSELVPVNSVPLHRLSLTDPTSSRSDTAHGQHRSSKSKRSYSTGRLAYLGKFLRERGVSAEAQELMLSAWRSSTNKNYDSAWRKWEDFCNDRNINLFSASIESILSFLASQFHKGHQYRSLNIYRSAISSIHPRIDGFEIGKHPMVIRLMKGIFNKRPPLPKYTTTWSVGDVLKYLRSLGCSSDLSLKDLSYKFATLLALVTAGRSSDLVLLSVNHFTSTREGIKFVLNGLSKQSRPNHTRPPFLVQKYIEDPLICPIEYLCISD